MPDSDEIIRATRFEDAMAESAPPAAEEQGDERERPESCGVVSAQHGPCWLRPDHPGHHEAMCSANRWPRIDAYQAAQEGYLSAASLTAERHRAEQAEGERDELEQNQRGGDEVVIHESRYAELKRAEREVERLREALEVLTKGAVGRIIGSYPFKSHPGFDAVTLQHIVASVHAQAVADLADARSALATSQEEA